MHAAEEAVRDQCVSGLQVERDPRGATGTAEVKNSLGDGLPIKRIGRPEEIANAVVFIASDKASFITGSRSGVDGGRLA